MSKQRSPGPWRWDGNIAGYRKLMGVGDDPIGWVDVNHHDARLIAAAPELLEALRAVVEMVDTLLPEDIATYDAARALLARIDGKG